MKPFAPLYLVLLLATSITHGESQPKCTLAFGGHSMATVSGNGKTVDLIGWEHLEHEDVLELRAGYESSLASARKGKCGTANKTLNRLLAKKKQMVGNANFVVHTLNGLHAIKSIDRVGAELSRYEWDSGKHPQILYLTEQIDEIGRLCGKTRVNVGILKSVLFGPEWTFVTTHPSASVLPVEDYDARGRNAQDFVTEVAVDFDDEYESPYHKLPGYQQISDALWLQAVPPESAIEEMSQVMGINPEQNERVLRRDIATWIRRIAGAYARNEYIVNALSTEPGHLAIVIGYHHVRDLAQKVLRACERDGANATYPALVNPVRSAI